VQKICPICTSDTYKTRFQMSNSSVLQCETCGLIFKSTILEKDAKEKTEAIYNTNEYWQDNPYRNDGGVNYDPQHNKVKLYRRDLKILAEVLPQKGRLLDVGCAKGIFLDVARQAGWQPVGLELSEWASQYARENFDLEVFTGTLDEAPWPEASFDAVIMLDVIEHLINPASAVSHVSHLLKPGGLFLVATPNGASFLHATAELIFKVTKGAVDWPLQKVYGFGCEGHVIFLSPNTLNTLLNKYGFEVLRFHFDTIDQGLWRPTTFAEKFAGVVDNVVGGLLNAKYRMTVYARKVL
jgi:2-polyprenyl-3-methyl-5-hydroxy-6-metoxy-1,4-benzoquinol methylase